MVTKGGLRIRAVWGYTRCRPPTAHLVMIMIVMKLLKSHEKRTLYCYISRYMGNNTYIVRCKG